MRLADKTRKPINDRSTGAYPKALFMIFAIVGAMFIWLLKGLALPTLIVILIPVGLIFCYCGLASLVALFYLREDQIGDNAYYLGFLYTLSSLSFALWKFSAEGSSPNDIIGSFGVGLWSTIVGISLRVFYAQMRQDPNDIEKEARAKIAETASALTTELHQATLSFNTYTRNLRQSVEEAFLQTGKTVNEGLIESIGKFTSTAETIGQKVEAVFTEFGSHSQQLNEASASTVKAIERLNARIDKVDAPDELLNTKITNLFDGLQQSNARFKEGADFQSQVINSIVKSSNTFAESVSSLNEQIISLNEKTSTIAGGSADLNHLSDCVVKLSKSFDQLSLGITALCDKQNMALDSISKHNNALEDQLARSRNYTDETHQALASMTRTLADKLS